MKPGMEPGQTAEVIVTVDDSMFAAFEGSVVHRLYGTAAMITHMELAGRKIILPYLEDHEEGVGYEIDVRHFAPTVAGMKVLARAILTRVKGNQVVTRVEAFNNDGKIGEGSFTQVIVSKATLEETVDRLENPTKP